MFKNQKTYVELKKSLKYLNCEKKKIYNNIYTTEVEPVGQAHFERSHCNVSYNL